MYWCATIFAASASDLPGGDVMDWVKIVSTVGFSGAMLWFVVAKVIPKMMADHNDALAKAETRHAEQEDRQRNDFLAALGKLESSRDKQHEVFLEQLSVEREARDTQFRETTAMGNAQAQAALKLNETMDGLRRDLNTNTEVLRTLEKQRRVATQRRDKNGDIVAL